MGTSSETPNPYLIQRCKEKSRAKESITGIDSLLSFDYMGSSEFEWGALPAALRRICEIADRLEVTPVPFKKKKKLFLVCSAHEKLEAIKMLGQVADEKHRTKEYVGIEAYLKGTEDQRGYRGYSAWWDIDHRWFACIDEELAELVIYAIKKVRDRWKQEGKL